MQGYDVMEEMYNEKTAAMNFVHELCKCRTKGNLEAFMTLCINVMNDYNVGSFCYSFSNASAIAAVHLYELLAAMCFLSTCLFDYCGVRCHDSKLLCSSPAPLDTYHSLLCRRQGRTPRRSSVGGWMGHSWQSEP